MRRVNPPLIGRSHRQVLTSSLALTTEQTDELLSSAASWLLPLCPHPWAM